MMINKFNFNDMPTPMVSICCIAFNQEKYIRQALESFLMQRTSFNIEIIVHDDASTDSTSNIIIEYATKFPFIIKPILQSENKYSTEGLNFQYNHVFNRANGKYIAFCEGDDFWIDPLKLQKQVDFLELNPDYGLVHTNAVHYNEKLNCFGKTIGFETTTFQNLLFENTISNLTVCLRKELFYKYINDVNPCKQTTWTTCDFPIWLWFIQHTKFKFLNEITGVYRIIDTSICHHKDDSKRLLFYEGLLDIIEFYLKKYNSPVLTNKIKARYHSMIISMYFFNKNKSGIKKSIPIFYKGNDWMNLFWIFLTLPLYSSYFLTKSSYYCRNLLFKIINRK